MLKSSSNSAKSDSEESNPYNDKCKPCSSEIKQETIKTRSGRISKRPINIISYFTNNEPENILTHKHQIKSNK